MFVLQTIVPPSKVGYFSFWSQDQLKVQICIYHNNGKQKIGLVSFSFVWSHYQTYWLWTPGIRKQSDLEQE